MKTCSSASSSGSSETSTPREGRCGAIADASEASTAAASGGSGVSWIVSRSSSSADCDHLQPQQAVALEPLGHDREDVAARLRAGADGLDERLGLFLGGRLEEGVDAPLAVEEPLGLEPDDQKRGLLDVPARTYRRLILVSGGHESHHRDGGKGRRGCAGARATVGERYGDRHRHRGPCSGSVDAVHVAHARHARQRSQGPQQAPVERQRRLSPCPCRPARRGARGRRRRWRRRVRLDARGGVAVQDPPRTREADLDDWDDDLEWSDDLDARDEPAPAAPVAFGAPAAAEPAAYDEPSGDTSAPGRRPSEPEPGARRRAGPARRRPRRGARRRARLGRRPLRRARARRCPTAPATRSRRPAARPPSAPRRRPRRPRSPSAAPRCAARS